VLAATVERLPKKEGVTEVHDEYLFELDRRFVMEPALMHCPVVAAISL